MKIFRIDGNKVYRDPEKGLKYFATNELAEEYLEKKGFYKETREFELFKTPTIPVWYDIRLSEDGCAYDNTNYRKIVEVDVNLGLNAFARGLMALKQQWRRMVFVFKGV